MINRNAKNPGIYLKYAWQMFIFSAKKEPDFSVGKIIFQYPEMHEIDLT
jgi:hypothetical protein